MFNKDFGKIWIEGYIVSQPDPDSYYEIKVSQLFGTWEDTVMISHRVGFFNSFFRRYGRDTYIKIHHDILNSMQRDKEKDREYSRYLG